MLRVDSLPTDEEIRNTSSYLWEHGNKNWEEFTVLLYLPFMSTESTAYRVAEFSKDGLVRYNKNDDALYGTKWETKKPEEPVKEIPVEKLKEYRIELSAINAGGRKIRINISRYYQ